MMKIPALLVLGASLGCGRVSFQVTPTDDGAATDGGSTSGTTRVDARIDALLLEGEIGGPCPMSGDCGLGVCFNGRCAAYGGTYVLDRVASQCSVGNPLAANTCSCPAGFGAEEGLVANFFRDSGATLDDVRYFSCLASGRPDAAYAGSYTTSNTPLWCPVRPNPLTGALSCPTGTAAVTFTVIHYCAASWTICHGDPGIDPGFGGAYIESCTGGCDTPNPLTGDCSCAPGTSALGGQTCGQVLCIAGG